MLYEYAVEPRAIGSSWQTFRYVIEKFGFDRGRLISQFPNTWFRLVYDAAEGFLPMEKKRTVEALNLAKRNKVVSQVVPTILWLAIGSITLSRRCGRALSRDHSAGESRQS